MNYLANYSPSDYVFLPSGKMPRAIIYSKSMYSSPSRKNTKTRKTSNKADPTQVPLPDDDNNNGEDDDDNNGNVSMN